MSIQSNINQGISLMSLLASQTPKAAQSREKAVQDVVEEKIAKEAAEHEAKFKTLQKHAAEGNLSSATTYAGEDAEMEVYSDLRETAKQRYLSNPTDETYSDYMDIATGYDEAKDALETSRADPVAHRAKLAERSAAQRLKAEQERIRKTPKLSAWENMPDTWSSMPDVWGSMPNVWDQTYKNLGGKK